MVDVGQRLEEVLRQRRLLLPRVDGEVERWQAVQGAVAGLRRAVRDAAPELEAAGLGELDVEEPARLADDALGELRTVRARLARRTVNVGVSGQARNGKSTALQSMSDLGDDQIPTGAGGPVTAVRSRIFHSTTRREAQLTLHTEASFCESVLAPYAAALGIGPRLADLDDLAGFDFPGQQAELAGRPDAALLGPMLVRLSEMRDGLPSFRALLTGRTQRVELAQLRDWVAYPAENTVDADRRYLAVRDAEIHCPFPLDELTSLGLYDLPGLGEILPSAEEHHLAGLQNDVDFVLVVKRPTAGNQLWRTEDAKALELIGQARGAAALRDFATVLVNDGGTRPEQLAALRADLLKRVNYGTPDSVLRVREADAADREAMRGVLADTLAHLSEALPRMDAAVIARGAEACRVNAAALVRVVEDALAVLRSVITPTPTEVLVERAAGLRRGLVASLGAWVAELADRASAAAEDAEFRGRAEAIHQEISSWAEDGFGEGVEAWTARALAEMNVEAGAAVFAERTLNALRVDIAHRYGAMDEIMTARQEDFWQGLVDALGKELDGLLDRSDGPAATLRTLTGQLRDAEAACPTLVRSLDFTLDVHLDYRTRALPQVRSALSALQPEPAAGTPGALGQLLPVERTPKGVRELHRRLAELAVGASYDAGRSVVGEGRTIAQALFAYGEQFEDAFIRSEDAEKEFRRLAESFRDQLWPREGSGPGAATLRIQRVRGALGALGRALGALNGDPEHVKEAH
ncbi:hypothetical protein ACFW1A_04935 [Kitasatospora sp. NPDC058965]|uniref:hypothetical protein n=1 Tax=Kitasatospora sp. NPDC058965 TaxID=3346682 RepID=UPI00369B45E9